MTCPARARPCSIARRRCIRTYKSPLDRASMPGLSEPVRAVRRLEYLVTAGVQQMPEEPAHALPVFRQQDRFRSRAGRARQRLGIGDLAVLLRARQADGEGGSSAWLAARPYSAACLLDDPVNGAQVEARAPAVLGSEERLKDLAQSFRIHTGAVVGDLQHDVAD